MKPTDEKQNLKDIETQITELVKKESKDTNT